MDSTGSTLLLSLFAIFLVFLNGFFVLSEFSIVKIRRSRLEELVKQKIPNSKLTLRITSNLDSFLSATQLGITLSSLGLGWIGEPAFARLLSYQFEVFFTGNPVLLHTISFSIAFSIITLLHVVLGELIPKSVAIAKPEKAALFVAKLLYFFWIIFYPLIKFFDFIAIFFLKAMGIKPASEGTEAHTEEELKFIAGESFKGGFIDPVEKEIIQNAVSFSDTCAKEVMTPRKDMICLEEENSFDENMQIITKARHTRYPFCKDGKDNIIGIIHVRDIMLHALNSGSEPDLSKLTGEILIVPEDASISKILIQMNKRHIHTALVLDEYGGTSGLLTMEDILSEVIGSLAFDGSDNSEQIKKIDDDNFVIDGMVELEEIQQLLSDDIFVGSKQVTIGGYVFNLLARKPVVGDEISDGSFSYKVLETAGARITSLRLTRLVADSEIESE